MVLVENWFDEHALRMNGTGHGRNDFHKYRMTGGRFIPGTEYWCKVVYNGEDVRDRLAKHAFNDLKIAAARHLDTIRNYAHLSGRSIYSFGWMPDISRCIYTLRTGGIISKTTAGG